ncbi:30S ribosomal protein S21, chloroplastic-like [Benincasa hispida]|uniref:30S ribosomal protein S21, chloroplastic-like n=1 Tax=Benincasa hispida TaxID=102211 RepID=UPI0019004F39|nr:30S ribosomal protein S21, chloroplastic-like [Benincasa hispida]
MAAAATSSLTKFFSSLSISKSSQIHHNSVSINLQSLPKSKPARLFATRGSVTPSSQEPKGVFSGMRIYNVLITVGENESEDQLVNRFRRQVLRAGILQECKRRRFFENSQAKRKRKAREAAKRNRKRWFRRPQSRAEEQPNKKTPQRKNRDEEDDNWDFYQVDLPYCS